MVEFFEDANGKPTIFLNRRPCPKQPLARRVPAQPDPTPPRTPIPILPDTSDISGTNDLEGVSRVEFQSLGSGLPARCVHRPMPSTDSGHADHLLWVS